MVLFSDEIFPPENPEPQEPVAIPTPPPRPTPAPVEPTPSVENPVAEAPVVETPVEENPPAQTDTNPATENTPVDPAVTQEPSLPVETPPVETPPTEVTTTVTEEPAPIIEETNVGDIVQPGPVSPEDSKDVVSEEPLAPGTEDNITEKILKDLEGQAKTSAQQRKYVAPPDYEYRGRGLVYNCTGKHWACVDGASYKICENNAAAVKFQKKKIECYPFNVYETMGGCEKIQYRMISSNAKTNFCNGN